MDVKTLAKKILDFYNDDPTRWTQDVNARDAAGDKVLENDPRAVCWCLEGASQAVGGYIYPEWWDFSADVYARVHSSISGYNDAPGRTFEEIKTLLEEMAA